jgi:uncharacterized integral membrane protein
MDRKSQRSTGMSDVTATRVAVRSRTSGLWVGMILSAVVLIFLLIFILQNRALVQITFLGWTGALPAGVALLFAAVAGLLSVAIPGSIRIVQLRHTAATAHRAGRVTPQPPERGPAPPQRSPRGAPPARSL